MALFCDKCGLCCKMLSNVKGMEEFDKGDGTCIYLKNNLCSIYEMRPNICDAEYMWITSYSKIMTHEDFEKESYASCIKIKSYLKNNNKEING